MENISRTRSSAVSLGCLFLSLLSLACGSRSEPLMLDIKTVTDTVALQQNVGVTFFTTTVVVHNRDSRPIALDGCYPAAQREIAGQWVTVFSPTCVGSGFVPIPAGDSARVTVRLSGYTTPGMLPRLDPRALPGNYRLVFPATLLQPDNSPASPSRSEDIRSAVFALH